MVAYLFSEGVDQVQAPHPHNFQTEYLGYLVGT